MNNVFDYIPPASEKQLKLIEDMRGYGCPEFEGTTIADADQYIKENMQFFKEQKRFMK